MDVVLPPAGLGHVAAGVVPGGRGGAPGAGRADGGAVRATGGRDDDGAPRFDQPVAPGGYLWWYVDAVSDDGRHALTLIAFVGSVFSPYYAWARERDPATPAVDHCAINVALYGDAGKRWTMTERSAASVSRDRHEFVVGPSRLQWDGASLVIDIDEIGMPLPQRVRGRVRVWPRGLASVVTPLDEANRHRWGPIAPASRIEVDLDKPAVRWRGQAYLDANEGDEPIDRPFSSWDWSRAALPDGGTAVIYDVRMKHGEDRVIAQRFAADGRCEPFEAPARQRLPRTRVWRIARHMRSEPVAPARVLQTLEDTPFYTRSLLESGLFGQRVQSVHETLSIPRLVAGTTRLMLPFRMPRVA